MLILTLFFSKIKLKLSCLIFLKKMRTTFDFPLSRGSLIDRNMPARKRVQGQQRRLRKYLRTQAQAYEKNPSILDEREKELESSLAKLDNDLAKLTSSDTAQPKSLSEEDKNESEAELKHTQIKRLTQMRNDMASLLAVNKRIRQSLAYRASTSARFGTLA